MFKFNEKLLWLQSQLITEIKNGSFQNSNLLIKREILLNYVSYTSEFYCNGRQRKTYISNSNHNFLLQLFSDKKQLLLWINNALIPFKK